jgi:hypothetical protein
MRVVASVSLCRIGLRILFDSRMATDSADHEHQCRSECRQKPAACEDCCLAAFRIAAWLRLNNRSHCPRSSEQGLGWQLPPPPLPGRCWSAGHAPDVNKEAIERLVVGVTVPANGIDDLRFSRLGDVGGGCQAASTACGVRAAAEAPGPSGPDMNNPAESWRSRFSSCPGRHDGVVVLGDDPFQRHSSARCQRSGRHKSAHRQRRTTRAAGGFEGHSGWAFATTLLCCC